MNKYILLTIASVMLLASCSESPSDVRQADRPLAMYPDYTDITIPVNIAPLNFLLRDDAERICIYAGDDESPIYEGKGNEVRWDEDTWHALLNDNAGKSIKVRLIAKYADGWREYKTFDWNIVSDRVDPYLTYRLIEPDYEVYNDLVIQERCVETFETRNISDRSLMDENRCMNCHTYAACDPQTSMLYVRGQGGGAIFNDNGKLFKFDIKTDDMVTGSVYFGFSPSKKYITFSTNIIIPAFHSMGSKRLEVFDTKSDVYVADMENHTIIRSDLLADSLHLETFPTFSPDGKYVYYCSAPSCPDSIPMLKEQKYSLCRIAWNESKGTFGAKVDTIYNGYAEGHSVCHPRISPDGRYLVFTIADYGTFPIWHREADLAMIDLSTGRQISMKRANSDMSDTYHSWSSNGRWLVFASKRDDGLYGKPYYTYIDKKGVCSKPFVLPQAHPAFYDNCLKSFNAPEQGTGMVPFSATDVSEALSSAPIVFR